MTFFIPAIVTNRNLKMFVEIRSQELLLAFRAMYLMTTKYRGCFKRKIKTFTEHISQIKYQILNLHCKLLSQVNVVE